MAPDEGIHYHVWIEYDEAVNTTNERVFDVGGIHPIITKTKPGGGWLAYCNYEY